MKLLELTPKTYKYYRENINNNQNESYDQARRKLTRNMLLAHEEPQKEGSNATLYKYGSLHILVADGKVVYLRNRMKSAAGWKLDKNQYVRLNKELGINGKSKMDLYKKEAKYTLMRSKSKIKLKMKDFLLN